MLICRSRSIRFLSSFNNSNGINFVSNCDDSVNLVKLDNSKRSLSACVVLVKEDRPLVYEMDSKKVFSKAGSNCACHDDGISSTPCPIHNNKQRSNSINRQRGNNDNKESINKNIPVYATGSNHSNIVASTSYGTAFLESVATNFHCPSVHQQLLFGGYLHQNVLFPYNNYPAAIAFQRSFSTSSVLDHQNSNVHYRNSVESRGSSSAKGSGSRSSARSNSILGMRRWDLTNFGKLYYRQNKTESGVVFTIISYNVLAQDLLMEHPELYNGNDQNALQWDFRYKNLYQEIKEKNGDILCLQEVQQSHIDKYFKKLETLGYNMIYKQRTGIRTDGCAIYYKTDKFNLVEYTTVEFRQPNTSILDRDNVAIVATFSPKRNPSTQFVVATTHLLYNPRRQDVRLAQTQVLLTEIERFAYRKNKNGDEYYIPILITGDFNSLPSSAIYQFIVNGKYKYENVMLRTRYNSGKVLIPQFLYITDNCQHGELVEKRMMNMKPSRDVEESMIRLLNSDQKVNKEKRHNDYKKHTFSSGMLTHNFNLGSVYKHVINNDVEGTTYQDEWVTVDYIFYSGKRDNTKFKESHLKLISTYTLPTASQLDNVRIPNFEVGSDHLSLIAKFKLEYN
ncbi:protein angel isoform X1 [Onthophagus taurus]|uniref:protein angel isoform X1 n=2 Tax=Onthophagus taurus TaxID=166361 RepID=UPI0039BE7809